MNGKFVTAKFKFYPSVAKLTVPGLPNRQTQEYVPTNWIANIQFHLVPP